MFLKDRIILVEDDELLSACLSMDITKLGYKVASTPSTAQQAIEDALYKSPDLILMDILLGGGMNGIEAAKRIRAHIDVPIIYTTGETEKKALDRIVETDPAGLLLKPFGINDLRSSIEIALQIHQSRRIITDRKFENIHLSVLSEKTNYESIKYALRNEKEIVLSDSNSSVKGLKNEIKKGIPHVVLIDRNFFEDDGKFLNLLSLLKSKNKSAKIIAFVSGSNRELRTKAISLGVSGFVDEQMSRTDFIKSIYAVFNDGTWFNREELMSFIEQSISRSESDFRISQQLSGKEKEVAVLASRGKSNKQIAHELYISENTVKSHLKKVYKKLGVKGRRELMINFQS